MVQAKERILFTSFICLLILAALFFAKDWPVRASIIILLLASIGVVLALCQLVLDFKALRGQGAKAPRPTFEVEALEHQGRWEAWKSGHGCGRSSSPST